MFRVKESLMSNELVKFVLIIRQWLKRTLFYLGNWEKWRYLWGSLDNQRIGGWMTSRLCNCDSSETKKGTIPFNFHLLRGFLSAEPSGKGPSGCKELTHWSFLRTRGIHWEDAPRGTWNQNGKDLGSVLWLCVCFIWAPFATSWFGLLALFWVNSLSLRAFAYT